MAKLGYTISNETGTVDLTEEEAREIYENLKSKFGDDLSPIVREYLEVPNTNGDIETIPENIGE